MPFGVGEAVGVGEATAATLAAFPGLGVGVAVGVATTFAPPIAADFGPPLAALLSSASATEEARKREQASNAPSEQEEAFIQTIPQAKAKQHIGQFRFYRSSLGAHRSRAHRIPHRLWKARDNLPTADDVNFIMLDDGFSWILLKPPLVRRVHEGNDYPQKSPFPRIWQKVSTCQQSIRGWCAQKELEICLAGLRSATVVITQGSYARKPTTKGAAMFPIRDTIPSRHLPLAVWLIVGLNIFVFWQEVSLSDELAERFFFYYGVIPRRIIALEPGSLHGIFTSMFIHGGLLHIILNLWMLLIFGDNVEDQMGHLRFLFFYLFCGVLSATVHVVFNAGSPLPTIGASGAIAGVMGAYFVMFPYARIVTLIPIFIIPFFVEIPAIVFLGVWFAGQISSGAFSAGAMSGGIAWWAHIGGFAAGMLCAQLFVRRDPAYFRQYYANLGNYSSRRR